MREDEQNIVNIKQTSTTSWRIVVKLLSDLGSFSLQQQFNTKENNYIIILFFEIGKFFGFSRLGVS